MVRLTSVVGVAALGVATADQCSDYACFGDNNNCRNYAKIQQLCGYGAVCVYDSSKQTDVCRPAFGEHEEVKDEPNSVCSDYACFGSDNNCRNYAKIQQLCGAGAVCRPNQFGTDVCQPAPALEVSDTCSDYACFGDDNNCQNYEKIRDLCGPGAVCRYDPSKGTDVCQPGYGELEQAKDEPNDVCSDYACFGRDENCRNYQKIVDLCGQNAVCVYDAAKGTSVCERTSVEVEVSDTCSDYACFGDDNNCQNYEKIRELCGNGARCVYSSSKSTYVCEPAYAEPEVTV